MRIVKIIKNWDKPDLLRQTPKYRGIWKDTQFTLAEAEDCDYVIVLNYSRKNIKARCSRENIWNIQQEPPNIYFKDRHKAHKIYYRVFTTDRDLKGERYIHSQPALPWHVNKDYDYLVKCSVPNKPYVASCITSLKRSFPGHKKRLRFLEVLKSKTQCNILATYDYHLRQKTSIQKAEKKIKSELLQLGYTDVVAGKWEGLSPYKYSLIIENFQGPYYFSEKLSDCFLAWTMPIYYGCTNITDYFPKESFVEIDIEDHNVVDQIKEVIASNLWRRNIKAIAYARKLILEKYQLFPFLVHQIEEWEKRRKKKVIEQTEIVIPNEDTFMVNTILRLNRLISFFR